MKPSDLTPDPDPFAPERGGGSGTAVRAGVKKPTRKRVPAEERRADVLRVAAEVVARDGMHAASTAQIAKGAGISHAYLFRLFPTKEELMVAVARENGRVIFGRMADAGRAARERGEDVLGAMGATWEGLLADETLLHVNLQGISASSMVPAVGDEMREAWTRIVAEIEVIAGTTPEETRVFLAQGMLLLVIAGLGAEQADWVSRLHGGPLPCAPRLVDEVIRGGQTDP